MLSIGEAAKTSGYSIETLRYYERIGLLPRVARDSSGRRRFDNSDLSRLHFIRRAQRCRFSLREIGQMLALRDSINAPREVDGPRAAVRDLTRKKLTEIEVQAADLDRLKRELTLLLNLCEAGERGCPIIEGIEADESGR